MQDQCFLRKHPIKSRSLHHSPGPLFAECADGTGTTVAPLPDNPLRTAVNVWPEFGRSNGGATGRMRLRLDTELLPPYQCRSEQETPTSPAPTSSRIKRRCSEPPISMLNRGQNRAAILPSPETLKRMPRMGSVREEWPSEEVSCAPSHGAISTYPRSSDTHGIMALPRRFSASRNLRRWHSFTRSLEEDHLTFAS